MKFFYLITYDIGDEKRLSKVRNFLKNYGVSVQKSVFECWISTSELKEIVSWLKSFLDKKSDRVRIYRICRKCLKNVSFSGIDDTFSEEPPEEVIF